RRKRRRQTAIPEIQYRGGPLDRVARRKRTSGVHASRICVFRRRRSNRARSTFDERVDESTWTSKFASAPVGRLRLPRRLWHVARSDECLGRAFLFLFAGRGA